jgi:hypothetical protein
MLMQEMIRHKTLLKFPDKTVARPESPIQIPSILPHLLLLASPTRGFADLGVVEPERGVAVLEVEPAADDARSFCFFKEDERGL